MKKLIAFAAIVAIFCVSQPAKAGIDMFDSIDGDTVQSVTDEGSAYKIIAKVYFEGSRVIDPKDTASSIDGHLDATRNFDILIKKASDRFGQYTVLSSSSYQVTEIREINVIDSDLIRPLFMILNITADKTTFDQDFLFKVRLKDNNGEEVDDSVGIQLCRYVAAADVVDYCDPFKDEERIKERQNGTVEIKMGTDIALFVHDLELYRTIEGEEDERISVTKDEHSSGSDMLTIDGDGGTIVLSITDDDYSPYWLDVFVTLEAEMTGTFFLKYGQFASPQFTVGPPEEEGQDDNDDTEDLETPCDDFDLDGVCDDIDNCFDVQNPDQADNIDGDGLGDACDDVDDSILPEDPEPEVADVIMPTPEAPEAVQQPVDEEDVVEEAEDNVSADTTASDADAALASWYDGGDCSLLPHAASGTAGPIALIVFAVILPLAIMRKRK